jgi:DNA repair exonuclease SbcCD ATPase subunit
MASEHREATLMTEHENAGEALNRQRPATSPAERALRAQRAELVRMMAEVKQVQEAVRSQQNPELEALRRENEQLRQALAQRQAGGGVPALPPEGAEELDRLRAEVDAMRQVLCEKDELVRELQNRPAPILRRDQRDLESYEAELNEFRRHLEEDRRKIAEEREQLRQHHEELAEATREMEMDLSRERAELARERTRLERLRDDARGELERVQRDASVMNRLAPVQRLREQLNEGRGS